MQKSATPNCDLLPGYITPDLFPQYATRITYQVKKNIENIEK